MMKPTLTDDGTIYLPRDEPYTHREWKQNQLGNIWAQACLLLKDFADFRFAPSHKAIFDNDIDMLLYASFGHSLIAGSFGA